MARFASMVRGMSALFMLKTRLVKRACSKRRTYLVISLSMRAIRPAGGVSERFRSRMPASLMPILTAMLWALAASIIRKMSSCFLMFPGFKRIFAAPASIASIALAGEKWMSAMRGTFTFWTILANAAVSALVGTAMRTSGQPAAASFLTWFTHRGMSVVGTLVIDWMMIGSVQPIFRESILTIAVVLLLIIW